MRAHLLFLFYTGLLGCSAGGGSGGSSDAYVTQLTCANAATYNSDIQLLITTLNDCFFRDASASVSYGSISATNNICTKTTKTATFSSPNYSSWMSSNVNFTIAKSGAACATISYTSNTGELIISKDGAYLYKDNTTGSGGTVVFKNRTWSIDTSQLTSCMNTFNYLSVGTGTGGSPPAASSSISFTINHLLPNAALVTANTSMPTIDCRF